MRILRQTLPGALLIVAQAAALALIYNHARTDGLPLVRRPLSTTRRTASLSEMLPAPAPLPVAPAPKIEQSEPFGPPTPKGLKPPPVPQPTPPNPKPATKPGRKPVVPAPATSKPEKVEAVFTNLDDAKKLFDEKKAIFVDARHKLDYDAEHIAGATSLFEEDVEKLYQAALGGLSKDAVIITYCSDPECESAIKLADALVARGHKRVFIMLEGLPGWKDAGYPTQVGQQ